MGHRLGVYRHDAVLAQVPAERTEIWIRHKYDVFLSKWHPISQAKVSNDRIVWENKALCGLLSFNNNWDYNSDEKQVWRYLQMFQLIQALKRFLGDWFDFVPLYYSEKSKNI